MLGLPLNFANIIALPLLLGVGVAFKIYYVMAWRRGMTGLVQSTLTRAVIFSALTTATAFGSLWLSSHPGTSSMGELMALALFCTMCGGGAVPARADGAAAQGRGRRQPPRGVAVPCRGGRGRIRTGRPRRVEPCAARHAGAATRRRDGVPMRSAAEQMPIADEQPAGDQCGGRTMPRASVAIDNLRAVCHPAGARVPCDVGLYRLLPHHPFALDARRFLWRAFPIVDQQRWFGFDLFCAWLDVFLMSFFYPSVRAVRLAEPAAQGTGRRFCRTGCCAWDCRSPRSSCC